MRALKQLQELDLTDRIQRYPNAPRHAIAARRFSDKTANGLTACIIRWMELHGHYATRITTTGRKLKDTAMVNVLGQAKVIPGQWIPGTTKKGTADVHAVVNGRHCSIEIKIGLDRMSDAQYKTKKEIESSGGLYIIAKDFDSFMTWYRKVVDTT